jgi:trimeric autotransporter adhesin
MKNFIKKSTKTVLLLSSFFYVLLSSAQAPNKFSYQAVIRNASNALVSNAPVGIKISVLQTTSTGTTVYSETHTSTTNINGLASIEIGGGTVVSGVFANINWANGPFFIKTETDPTGGTSYSIVGTSQLLSVPYALFASNTANTWGTLGNASTSPATNFIGTTDNQDVVFKRNGLVSGRINGANLSFGQNSLLAPTASFNSAFGTESLQFITSGQFNSAVGYQALRANTTGAQNTAFGADALTENTTAQANTAVGYRSLLFNQIGFQNTAIGANTLESNVEGDRNTAVGNFALKLNTNNNNTAVGFKALEGNVIGLDNTALGHEALLVCNRNYNTAVGNQAAKALTTGNYSVAIGNRALATNIIGDQNVAVGAISLEGATGAGNTAIGYFALGALGAGLTNTAVGNSAMLNQTSGNNNTSIGYQAVVPSTTGNNQVRIGNTAVAYAGVQVAWTITSDRRWKSNIQKSNLGLEFIKNLNPVSYTRKDDDSKKVEYGFIAQEIEESLTKSNASNTGIITKGDDGMYGVRYNDLIAPIVNALQELDEKNKQLIIENQELKTQISAILKRLDNLEK